MQLDEDVACCSPSCDSAIQGITLGSQSHTYLQANPDLHANVKEHLRIQLDGAGQRGGACDQYCTCCCLDQRRDCLHGNKNKLTGQTSNVSRAGLCMVQRDVQSGVW
jgi:hypothetical protein